jgi:hypothetical protein
MWSGMAILTYGHSHLYYLHVYDHDDDDDDDGADPVYFPPGDPRLP